MYSMNASHEGVLSTMNYRGRFHDKHLFNETRNIVSVLRNPLDCCASLMICADRVGSKEFAKESISYYLDFNTRMAESESIILSFEDVVTDINNSIFKVYSKLNIESDPEEVNPESVLKKIYSMSFKTKESVNAPVFRGSKKTKSLETLQDIKLVQEASDLYENILSSRAMQ
jgi:hypothetical protein